MWACGGLSEAELAYNDGVAASAQELYTEAISHYDKAIQLDLNEARPYLGRAYAYNHLGQHQRAIRDHDKACYYDTPLMCRPLYANAIASFSATWTFGLELRAYRD